LDSFNTPVLLLIFNRPDATAKVLQAIAEVKPRYLFVAADGPRNNNPEDVQLCAATRRLIKDAITWPAEVKTLFRDENLGCGKGPADAITWFFSHVTEGIILEDDCIANRSFFTYCKELLEYYKADDRIMHIGGTNFQPPGKKYTASYYFSSIAHGWGWATWKRAWNKFSFEIKDLPAFIASGQITKYHDDPKIIEYWYGVFRSVGREHLAAVWDHQWTYAIWKSGGLTIIPAINLVSNIGYGTDATHTKEPGIWSDMPTKELLNIIHPGKMIQDRQADAYTFYRYYTEPAQVVQRPSLLKRFKKLVKG